MKLVRAKVKPVRSERQAKRVRRERSVPPRVSAQQAKTSNRHIADESRGEISQLETILTTTSQLTLLTPHPTIPAPTSALMTVCVPLIGMPKIEELIMNRNDARETASMSCVYKSAVCSPRPLIMS